MAQTRITKGINKDQFVDDAYLGPQGGIQSLNTFKPSDSSNPLAFEANGSWWAGSGAGGGSGSGGGGDATGVAVGGGSGETDPMIDPTLGGGSGAAGGAAPQGLAGLQSVTSPTGMGGGGSGIMGPSSLRSGLGTRMPPSLDALFGGARRVY